jgi:hypothetical protein
LGTIPKSDEAQGEHAAKIAERTRDIFSLTKAIFHEPTAVLNSCQRPADFADEPAAWDVRRTALHGWHSSSLGAVVCAAVLASRRFAAIAREGKMVSCAGRLFRSTDELFRAFAP